MACFRRAIELKPDNAEARIGLAGPFVVDGRAQSRLGRNIEWRWRAKGQPPQDAVGACSGGANRWRDELCLLHAEQGLGDTIQFVRYAAAGQAARSKGDHGMPAPVTVRLLSECPGIDRLGGRGDELPEFDVHAPLLSVPGIFRTCARHDSRPAMPVAVCARPALVEKWRRTAWRCRWLQDRSQLAGPAADLASGRGGTSLPIGFRRIDED